MKGLVLAVLCLIGARGDTDPIVEVRLEHGKFVPTAVHVPRRGRLKLVNADNTPYTVEGAGALPGDVLVPAHQTRTVDLLSNPGQFYAIIEENPSSELKLDMEGDPDAAKLVRPVPFDEARKAGRQPLLLEPGHEPAYAVYTTFDISGRGEDAQQAVLRELYLLQEALSSDRPPEEFRLFFAPADWESFRRSVSLVYALGPGAYSAERFGPRIAAVRPPELRELSYAPQLGLRAQRTPDVLVRVASDRHWFNLGVVRWIWRRLHGQIVRSTMESGYANPNGRSPLLGGFFDGTGNPYGKEREVAVFGSGNGTYLALFRINFDEERFRARPLSEQQALIGRQRDVGKPLKDADPKAHMNRAGADPNTSILRQPFVFDEGPGRTGLLFGSLQASPRALDRILHGFMLGSPNPKQKRPRDSFLSYMKFESAALYYVPSSPRGSFPGSLRFGGR